MSFDESSSASKHLAAVLLRTVHTVCINGHVPIGELFDDTRSAVKTIAVRVLIIDPKTIVQGKL